MKSMLGVAIFLCITICTVAQTEDAVINANINIWNKYSSRRSPDLFLQPDKSVYMVNEQILFTAYLLDRGGDTTVQDVLHVALIDLAAKKVLTSDRFFMHEGVSSGSLLVPDSAENGDYLLVAYTNIGNGGNVRLPIRIRSGKRSPFTLSVTVGAGKIGDPGTAGEAGAIGRAGVTGVAKAQDSIPLTCRIITDYMGLAAGAAFRYDIYADGIMVQRGKRVVDAFGECHLSLVPEDTLAQSILLYSTVIRQGVTERLCTQLVLQPRKIKVSYYPEGGYLVDGHAARIGVAINAANGMGISVKGVLTEDGKDLCDLQTNKYGIAVLDCTVHKGRVYQLRLADLPAGDYAGGQFPEIAAEGFSLRVANGVCRDSMTVAIQGPRPDSKAVIMVYNEQSLLYTARVGLPSGGGKFAIPVKGWPMGIAEVTLYSEDGEPVAERAIFLRGEPVNVSVRADSTLYHTRSLAKLQVRVTDRQNKGVAGMFSLTSVKASSVNVDRYPDIVDHAGFERYLPAGHGPMSLMRYSGDGLAIGNDSAIDLVLLTRYWTKDRWKMLKEDTAMKGSFGGGADDFGYVLHDGRKVRKPVSLFLMGSSMYNFSTDSAGRFQIPARALVAPFGGNPMVAVLDKKDQAAYNIILENRYDSVNDAFANGWYVPQIVMSDTAAREEDEEKPGFRSAKTLKAVVVKIRSGDVRYYPGSCSDQVCMYGVLNCPNHPGCCRTPRNGEEVIVPGYGPMIYAGKCADNASFFGAVRAVHLVREYYNKDAASYSPLEAALLPTLYWAPLIVTDDNGEATVNVYTDDLTGRFVNIVQGVAGGTVFGGIGDFVVSP